MKGTKYINWSTPKHIQEEADRKKPHFRSSKRPKVCKATKGEHTVVWEEWQEYSWTRGKYRHGKCSECGKKFYDWT